MGLSAVRPDQQQTLSEQQQQQPPPPPQQQPLPAQPPQSFVNQLPPMSGGHPPPSFDHLVPAAPGDHPLSPGDADKLAPQFKVKPASALMPDDKKAALRDKAGFKKKSRSSNKSPVGSPHPPLSEQPMFGMEATTGKNRLEKNVAAIVGYRFRRRFSNRNSFLGSQVATRC